MCMVPLKSFSPTGSSGFHTGLPPGSLPLLTVKSIKASAKIDSETKGAASSAIDFTPASNKDLLIDSSVASPFATSLNIVVTGRIS